MMMNSETHDADPTERSNTQTFAFHRVGRTSSGYRWWKPAVVGVITTTIYAFLLLLVFVWMAIAALADPTFENAMEEFLRDPETLDMTDPFTFAMTMISIMLMLPALLIATRVLGAKPVGLLSSVTGRIRWSWLVRCMGLAVAVFGAGYLTSLAIVAFRGESVEPTFDNPQLWTIIAITVLLVPFQAAAEEFVFRGYLMQTIGGWLRHPVFAIALPVPLFVLGHDYELFGMIDVAVFAIVAGWLSWRTGGLEAAIALHIVNNCAISVLGAIGLVDVNATELGVADLTMSLVIMLVFAIVVTWSASRCRIKRGKSVIRVRAERGVAA